MKRKPLKQKNEDDASTREAIYFGLGIVFGGLFDEALTKDFMVTLYIILGTLLLLGLIMIIIGVYYYITND